jgi:nitroreductase
MPHPSVLEPWAVSPVNFPQTGSIREQLLYMLKYAILAPSSHNAQPWKFRLHDSGVEIRADRERTLPVTDPEDRQMFIGLGAAAFNLIVAMRRFGYRAEVAVVPDEDDPDLAAFVGVGEKDDPSEEIHALFDAIPRRHTNRRPFELRPVSYTIFEELESAAKAQGTWLVRLHPDDKLRAAELIAIADKRQFHDRAFRKEIADWLVNYGSKRQDGMPSELKGFEGTLNYAAPLLVRTFDSGNSAAARDHELATGSPLLVIMGTQEDKPPDWVRTGLALEHVSLAARAHGISLSYLNQAIEVADMRPQITDVAEQRGWSQLVLRMGYGPEAPKTPRRPVENVLID